MNHIRLLIAFVLACLPVAQAQFANIPKDFSLYTSADGLVRFPYPAGWIATYTDQLFVVATSMDTLDSVRQETYNEFVKKDMAAGMRIWNVEQLGLKPGKATPEAIGAVFTKMMTSEGSKKQMADLGAKVNTSSPVTVNGKTYAGVTFDGKMTGFYMAYEYKPGLLLSLITIRKGPHDQALEKKLLWAGTQLQYTGKIPVYKKHNHDHDHDKEHKHDHDHKHDKEKTEGHK